MEESNLQNNNVSTEIKNKDLGKGASVFASGLLSMVLGAILYIVLISFAIPRNAEFGAVIYTGLYLVVSCIFIIICWLLTYRKFRK